MTASLSYDGIPSEPREYVVPGMWAIGETTVDAGKGDVGKGVKNVGLVARVALGLPMPGEDRATRHAPGRVLWLAAGCEDDPIHDLSGRFAAALTACAEEFGLDPAKALQARRYLHDLSAWENGDPVSMPNEEGKLRAEVLALNELDAANREPADPDYAGPGPSVRVVLIDPLDAILGEGYTIDSRHGARRVMAALNRFAKAARVALPVVHHMIASGTKIAGNPAVTDSVRLAFITRVDAANENVRVVARFKSNASRPDDVRYVIALGPNGYPFAAFTGDQAAAKASSETLRDRVAEHGQESAQSAPGATLRERVRAAAGERPAASPWPSEPARPAAADPGPFRVLRRRTVPGAEDEASVLGSDYVNRATARAAATADAGTRLSWKPAARLGTDLATDSGTGYAVYAVRP